MFFGWPVFIQSLLFGSFCFYRYSVKNGFSNLRIMISFLRKSLVHNCSEYIVLKFEIMHVLIFENDFEKTERIDARVWTHDVGINVKPVSGCARSACSDEWLFRLFEVAVWWFASNISNFENMYDLQFEIPTYLFLKILFSQWNGNISNLSFQRICFWEYCSHHEMRTP